jgi:hypothetical protein
MTDQSSPDFGTGPYESLCTQCLTAARAELVIVIVKGGIHGAGFEVQMTDPKHAELVPKILEDIARGVREGWKVRFPHLKPV